MTERRHPELLPLPGQLETALRLVHRRRRRSALTGASAVTTSVVVALGLSLTQPGGTASLRPADPDTTSLPTPPPHSRRSVDEASITGTRPGRAAAPQPTEQAPSPASPSTTSSVTVTPSSSLPTVAAGEAVTPEPLVASPAHRRRARMQRTGPYPPGEGPAADLQDCPSGGWCTQPNVTRPASGGFRFTYLVCRAYVGTSGQFAFTTNLETEFVVENARGQSVWRWSAGQVFGPDPETFDVPASNCVSWATTWDGVLDSGKKPPSGSYTLRAKSAMVTGNHPPETSLPFTV